MPAAITPASQGATERHSLKEDELSSESSADSGNIPMGTVLKNLQLGFKWPPAERFSGALFKAALAEFIGTMLLVLVGTGTVVFGCHSSDVSTSPTNAAAGQTEVPEDCFLNVSRVLTIAAAFGFVVLVLVYVTASFSGGHLNPAITLGFLITRKVTLMRAAVYWVAQLAGAILGSAFVRAIDPSGWSAGAGGQNRLLPGIHPAAGWLLETLLTMLLVLTVFAATDTSRSAAAPHVPILAPLAIGMAVFVAHLAAVAIDGCSVNPARSFAPAVVSGLWENQWIFWVGPFSGSIIAALIYELCLRPTRHRVEPPSSTEEAAGRGHPSKAYAMQQHRMPLSQLPVFAGASGARQVDMSGMRMILVPEDEHRQMTGQPQLQQQQSLGQQHQASHSGDMGHNA